MADQYRFVYKPAWVANTFLERGREEGVFDIDPLKIQKLVYCLHGWHLATTGAPAIGERVEAWPHGPVVSSLYHQFKKYRFSRIREFAHDVDPSTGEEAARIVAASDRQFYDIFNRVWDRYKEYSGQQLSDLTHAPGTPWSYARENGLQYIPDNLIKSHFVELGRRAA